MRLEGFRYGTTLDLNMGYYHIELSAKSKELCTIVTQWVKYEYQQIPMGLCNSPDIFQEKMSELFIGLDTVRVYIDDFLHVTKLLESFHYGKKFFLSCGVILLGAVHISWIESDGIALFGYDCANF